MRVAEDVILCWVRRVAPSLPPVANADQVRRAPCWPGLDILLNARHLWDASMMSEAPLLHGIGLLHT